MRSAVTQTLIATGQPFSKLRIRRTFSLFFRRKSLKQAQDRPAVLHDCSRLWQMFSLLPCNWEHIRSQPAERIYTFVPPLALLLLFSLPPNPKPTSLDRSNDGLNRPLRSEEIPVWRDPRIFVFAIAVARSLLPALHRHFDRSCSWSHREQRSGEIPVWRYPCISSFALAVARSLLPRPAPSFRPKLLMVSS